MAKHRASLKISSLAFGYPTYRIWEFTAESDDDVINFGAPDIAPYYKTTFRYVAESIEDHNFRCDDSPAIKEAKCGEWLNGYKRISWDLPIGTTKNPCLNYVHPDEDRVLSYTELEACGASFDGKRLLQYAVPQRILDWIKAQFKLDWNGDSFWSIYNKQKDEFMTFDAVEGEHKLFDYSCYYPHLLPPCSRWEPNAKTSKAHFLRKFVGSS